MPQIEAIGDFVTITPDGVFYLALSKNPQADTGLFNTTRLPLLTSCWIARFVHSNWLMNAFIQSHGRASLQISAANGRKIVLVRLIEGERLGVNIKNLIGFSRGISLATSISLSIAAFAIERNFVHIATGPGLLAFEVSGQPTTQFPSAVTFSARLLVAWSPNTEFRFDYLHALSDVYFNELRVTAATGSTGFLLLDADTSMSPRSRNWMWRLIRSVYIPG